MVEDTILSLTTNTPISLETVTYNKHPNVSTAPMIPGFKETSLETVLPTTSTPMSAQLP